MNVNVFIDTNIIVYAYDTRDAIKHEKAKKLLNQVWDGKIHAAVSIQVLQEFFNSMIRAKGDPRYFRKICENFMDWPLVENTRDVLRQAFAVQARYQLSFYDANIVAAAQLSGAQELWTEDFNTGQDYDGVIAVNPFTGES